MRLFVAVWPPEPVVEALHGLPRPDDGGVRWCAPEQWHVTLRFLGSVDDDDVDEVRGALSSISMPAPSVRLGPATKRLGKDVLVLPVHGLDDLAHEVVRVTEDIVPAEERHFTGHLTVARARTRGSLQRALEGLPLAATWTPSSFSLVRSQTKPTGAVYTDIERYPLGQSA